MNKIHGTPSANEYTATAGKQLAAMQKELEVIEVSELLKELNDDEKAQIKAVIIGMMLARGMQDKKNTTNCTEQTA